MSGCDLNRSRFVRDKQSNLCVGLKAVLAAEKQKAQSEDWAKCLIYLVGRAGFEPATNGLKVRCSTN